jgi:hypothetical protein
MNDTGDTLSTIAQPNTTILTVTINNGLHTVDNGRCAGMEINVKKTKVMRISRQLSPLNIMINQKKYEPCEIFELFGEHEKCVARCSHAIKIRIAWQE